MNKSLIFPQAITYLAIFLGVWLLLTLFPPPGGYVWASLFINISSSLLFTLLVALTARMARTDSTVVGILCTTLFLQLFLPGADKFFLRDESALMELSSQCIVPFFMMQYMRTSRKDFHRWYFLMLLMGIFCSFTHNGITIPLCTTFIWLSFLHRKLFFRRACWPMVVGFVIGTALSIWSHWDDSLTLASDLQTMTSVTSIALHTLWDTKVFILSVVLTSYLLLQKNGRRTIKYIAYRHFVPAMCTGMSLLTLPLAPLGIDNAVTGVCFFSMLWALFVIQYLSMKYFKKRL